MLVVLDNTPPGDWFVLAAMEFQERLGGAPVSVLYGRNKKVQIIKSSNDAVQAIVDGAEMDVTRTKSGWHARVRDAHGRVIFDGDLDARTASEAIAETMRRGRLG